MDELMDIILKGPAGERRIMPENNLAPSYTMGSHYDWRGLSGAWNMVFTSVRIETGLRPRTFDEVSVLEQEFLNLEVYE